MKYTYLLFINNVKEKRVQKIRKKTNKRNKKDLKL